MSVLFTRRGKAPAGGNSGGSGTLASDIEVGSSVFLKLNGTLTEFLVVHQGNPDTSMYDTSCDGTWLLMKDIYTGMSFGNSNDYANSNVHTYLNGDFFSLFDAGVQSAIKLVKIPYVVGTTSTTVASGSNGLSTKVFLLSSYEVGLRRTGAGYGEYGYVPVDGVCLSYFEKMLSTSSNFSLTIAYYNNTAT